MMQDTARLELTVSRGDETTSFATNDFPVTIGRKSAKARSRDAKCSLQLDDDAVSRSHCRLELKDGKVLLVDLDSANGTWFGDERVRELTLEPGSSFRVGNTELRLEALRTREADPLVGQQLAGYELRAVMGRGGSGVVYRAHQIRLDREVAVKVLDTEEATAEELAAFEREARAAAALDHPSLVRVYDIGEDQGRHYFAMELATGGNVATRIRRAGPYPWREAVAITTDVAHALAQAHDADFVHGDVKPANILLSADGKAKLGDLGLVRTSNDEARAAIGTAAFIAPEQVLRKPADARSDLYSLGCTLFMMLSGRRVFDRGTSSEIAAAHVKEPAPLLSDVGADVPSSLQLLVARLLEKDPAKRPQSAEELVAALDAVEEDPPPTVRRTPRRRRSKGGKSAELGAYALLYILIIVALIAGTIWLTRK